MFLCAGEMCKYLHQGHPPRHWEVQDLRLDRDRRSDAKGNLIRKGRNDSNPGSKHKNRP